MKKIALLLVCLLCLALVSCADKEDGKTEAPSATPTEGAVIVPTTAQTTAPTDGATSAPTELPTQETDVPTGESTVPTDAPSEEASADGISTDAPSDILTDVPTDIPTVPTDEPTVAPTDAPTDAPTVAPTNAPTELPTEAFALVYEKNGDAYRVIGYRGTALDVVIPETYEGLPITEIGDDAFAGCATLQSVALPSSLTVIGEGAFKECRVLKNVTLPADILAIEANAFQRCNAIESVTFGGSETAWKRFKDTGAIGTRNHTLTGAAFTYLDQPSIHDEPEVVLDKIYTIIQPKTMTLSNGDNFNYRMYVPEDYDASKAYPVLILLHGAGERGDDNTLQMKNMVATLFADANSPIQDSIFLCPQCPSDNQWVDTPWAEGDYRTDEVPESNEILGVLEMLASVRASHNVDANRIYIMGISMGGFGTWDIIVRHPDIFAAAIPICGGGDSSKAATIAHIPIRTFHGDADSVVPVDGTRAMVEALLAVGGNINYEELPGYGHNVWDYVAEKAGLMDWLFSQRKGETDIEVNIGDLMGQ